MSCAGGPSAPPRRQPPQCPVCLEEHLLPPVYQCPNGHLICKECQPRVTNCPVCRHPFLGQAIRSLIAEEVIQDYRYECPNSGEGCDQSLKFEEIQDHKLDCQYAALNFCQALGLNCTATVKRGELVGHLQAFHSVQGFEESSDDGEMTMNVSQELSEEDLRGSADAPETLTGDPIFFKFRGGTFFVKTVVDKRDNTISWMICIAGSETAGRIYEGMIRVLNIRGYSHEGTGPVRSFQLTDQDIQGFIVPLKTVSTLVPVSAAGERRDTIRVQISVRAVGEVSQNLERRNVPSVNSFITTNNDPSSRAMGNLFAVEDEEQGAPSTSSSSRSVRGSASTDLVSSYRRYLHELDILLESNRRLSERLRPGPGE